jgi:adenylosuccinate synthase
MVNMLNKITNVDIVCGLAWGDEAKGKIVAHLAKSNKYNFICRWAGGNNAGHTIFFKGTKYKTHLIPTGVFYGIKSIIGPDCVINRESFFKEINYLKKNGFDTTLIKISPKAHIILDKHIEEDKIKYYKQQGTTAKGIAPCYRDKYARIGIRVGDDDFKDDFKDYIWDEKLYGNILCEGAQGFWLDINYGNYPFVTSSSTLPYSSCSLGFSPKLINNIYGACKIYDTRSGLDPEFPEKLLNDLDLKLIGNTGNEYGVTTGRRRKVNWLDINKLKDAINISGTTHLIISKIDIFAKLNIFKLKDPDIISFDNMILMKKYIEEYLCVYCDDLIQIIYSDDVENINDL